MTRISQDDQDVDYDDQDGVEDVDYDSPDPDYDDQDDDQDDDQEDDDQEDDDQEDDDQEDDGGVEVLDPAEVVEGLIDRVQTAQLLDRDDIADLAQVIGQRQAQRLARALNRELREARRRRPHRTFLQWMFGSPVEGPEPLPDSVSRVLLRIQSGQLLDRADAHRLVSAAGRAGARLLERQIRQTFHPRRGRRWGR